MYLFIYILLKCATKSQPHGLSEERTAISVERAADKKFSRLLFDFTWVDHSPSGVSVVFLQLAGLGFDGRQNLAWIG